MNQVKNADPKFSLKTIEQQVKALMLANTTRVEVYFFDSGKIWNAVHLDVVSCFQKSGKFYPCFGIQRSLEKEWTTEFAVKAIN